MAPICILQCHELCHDSSHDSSHDQTHPRKVQCTLKTLPVATTCISGKPDATPLCTIHIFRHIVMYVLSHIFSHFVSQFCSILTHESRISLLNEVWIPTSMKQKSLYFLSPESRPFTNDIPRRRPLVSNCRRKKSLSSVDTEEALSCNSVGDRPAHDTHPVVEGLYSMRRRPPWHDWGRPRPVATAPLEAVMPASGVCRTYGGMSGTCELRF